MQIRDKNYGKTIAQANNSTPDDFAAVTHYLHFDLCCIIARVCHAAHALYWVGN
jgi:hypothetical protein